jgi:membrane associated rhomboid family serine protease
MVLLVFILLAAASGAYFSSIGCRWALARHRRPGWYFALLGILATVLLTTFFLGEGDLFRPAHWDDGKVGFWLPMIIISGAAAIVAFLSSVVVVIIYRARFRNEKHAA